jgi:DNA-binding winged helix-turn-helix (wHTH) protein/TolB-like protein/Tfp pilus assembly protein PilF
MAAQTNQIYEFGPFRLDAVERVLLRDGRPEPLTPKAFDVLLMLVESNGHIVEKDELMNRVWAGSFVEEGNLKVAVSTLRKAIEADAGDRRFIETVPRRGYRFVASVKEVPRESTELVVREQTTASITIEQSEESEGQEQEKALTAAKRKNGFRAQAAIACLAVIGLAVTGLYFWTNRTAPGQQMKSIAVLPFKPVAADARDESLEMGIADTLITKLSNIRNLTVRPMSSVRKYSGLEQDAVLAGREQRVDAVLDGSIQKAGEKVRVTVRLMSMTDGATLWTSQFDEKFTDIFAVQDSISERVAETLALRLSHDERILLTKHYTENTEAYQLYLKGRYYWSKRTYEGIKKGIEYFQQAIEKDPRHALAYADLARSYKASSYYGIFPPSEAQPKSKEAIRKALEIDKTLAEAHMVLATILESSDWNWQAAEAEFKVAIELMPNDATAHHLYGLFLERRGRLQEATVEMAQALKLDPVSLIINKNVGDPFYYLRHYDEAIEQYRKTLELDPNFFLARLWLGKSYEQKGLYKEAIQEFQNAQLSEDAPSILGALGHVYAVLGNRVEAEKTIKKLKALSERYVAPYHIAIIYAGLQKNDEAFEWLEGAYQARDEWLLYLKIDPSLDSLRSDLRFEDLLRRVGFPQ